MMIEKYLNKLEYNKILDLVSNYCSTYIGKDFVSKLMPLNNKDLVKMKLEETSTAQTLLYRKGEPPISNITNIDIGIKNLESYNSLSAKALLDVAHVLQTSRFLHDYFFADDTFDLSDFSLLEDYFSMLYYNETIEKNILNSIIDEYTIADDASKTLSALRRNKRKLEQDVRDKLSNFIHSSSYSKYLMDSIITIRNDRFVIPVKEEYKDSISGAILDISASGSTVYIEPSSIFELNNKINGIKAEESIEIEKILKNLSLSLFPIASKIKTTLGAIGQIDFIFAKAKYSKKINGICPLINDKKEINLYGARHPLISPEVVVPIDVSLGNNYTSLLITGPNTGGKTVTLKTVGLFCLMACSGILIPARENSSIFVFDNVFADIGDEQSIQESLSTFSSHMVNIIEILKEATSSSLVLLDELGSGTDPVEGASLAISILENLHTLGALTICTTHYPELKKYALTHEGFENASSDFDVEHLRPTYKLLIGIPGKSNAFAISSKLGLPDYIIEDAKSHIDSDNEQFEDVLSEIERQRIQIEKDQETIAVYKSQIKSLKRDYELKTEKLNEQRDKILNKAREEAVDILKEAKETADEAIKTINKYGKSGNTREMEKSRSNVGAKLKKNQVGSSIKAAKPKKAYKPSDFKLGTGVKVLSMNLNGTVASLPNAAGNLTVKMGILNSKVNIRDLEIIDEPDIKAPGLTRGSTGKIKMNKSMNIKTEINLIGKTVDEAISQLDKYLDDAYIAHLPQVYVIHGKGTGALRNAVQNHLKKCSYVKSYRTGEHGEGGAGATVVEFK